jgi:hypothetical protein
MKRLVIGLVIAATLVIGSGVARASGADDDYEDSIMHPLRIAYYLLHPVGFAAEWLIGRPFYYVISRPYLDKVFGYYPPSEEGAYRQQYGDRL